MFVSLLCCQNLFVSLVCTHEALVFFNIAADAAIALLAYS